jgi:hypothetical protein
MAYQLQNRGAYPKVSGLAAWSENCKWYSSLSQLYRYFVSQSSEFCHHNPSCCFSTSNTKGKRIFYYDSVRKLLDTPSYLSTKLARPQVHHLSTSLRWIRKTTKLSALTSRICFRGSVHFATTFSEHFLVSQPICVHLLTVKLCPRR